MLVVDVFIAVCGATHEYACVVLKGEMMQNYLDNRPANEMYQVSEDIIYDPNLFAIFDKTKESIPIMRDLERITTLLEPIQKTCSEQILCSALIPSPEKLKANLKANPRAHMKRLRAAARAELPAEADYIPMLFYDFGELYLGFQHRLMLHQHFDLAFNLDLETLDEKHWQREIQRYSGVMYWADTLGLDQYTGEFLIYPDRVEFIAYNEEGDDSNHFILYYSQITKLEAGMVTLRIKTEERHYDFSMGSFEGKQREAIQYLNATIKEYNDQFESDESSS